MKDGVLIKELIKDKNVGAIAVSSNHISRKMLEKIDFSEAMVILEYGSGNGSITKQLLKNMNEKAVLFGFETNKSLFKQLSKINDRRLVIVEADAENAKKILKNIYSIEKVNYVISTIPFTFMDKRKRRRIIYRAYSLLHENGMFITYQYSWIIHRLIKRKFSASSIRAVWLNLPPAFICEGVK